MMLDFKTFTIFFLYLKLIFYEEFFCWEVSFVLEKSSDELQKTSFEL